MLKSWIFIAISIYITSTLYATTTNSQTISFMPENDQYINIYNKNVSDITEEIFNQTLNRIEQIYAPIVGSLNKNLSIERDWTDGTVNAYAQQQGRIWTIHMFGGLARHSTVTQDGFALVACHEMGHHLGGLPKKRIFFGSSWAACEGQADYFGVTKCLKRYFENEDNLQIVSQMNIPLYIRERCEYEFSNPNEIAKCARGAMAGLSIGRLFEDLLDLENPINFSTPDTSVVSRTNVSGYPKVQCRLDTYLQGSLCNKDPLINPSSYTIHKGYCSRQEGYNAGARPLCWFKP